MYALISVFAADIQVQAVHNDRWALIRTARGLARQHIVNSIGANNYIDCLTKAPAPNFEGVNATKWPLGFVATATTDKVSIFTHAIAGIFSNQHTFTPVGHYAVCMILNVPVTTGPPQMSDSACAVWSEVTKDLAARNMPTQEEQVNLVADKIVKRVLAVRSADPNLTFSEQLALRAAEFKGE